jgi:uncharacterized DUF497 family protein
MSPTANMASLALALELDWDPPGEGRHPVRVREEMRTIALAPKTEVLYYVAYVERGAARRIISLRRANRREVKHYVESF